MGGEYDAPEFIALRKYGAEIVDATGRLKDFKDITEEVFEAWEKADAAAKEAQAFEKQLRDIERWKEAQRERAKTEEEVSAIVAEAAAKEAQAFEREVDRIKNLTQSLEDKIFDIDHSQYEKDLRRIQQDYLKTAHVKLPALNESAQSAADAQKLTLTTQDVSQAQTQLLDTTLDDSIKTALGNPTVGAVDEVRIFDGSLAGL